MQLLLDNLLATVVAAVVGLALVAVTLGGAEGTRDQTRFYAHQTAQAQFSTVLEADLTNAGIGTPAGAAAVEEASATRLAFYAAVDAAGTTGLVEYRVLAGGTSDGSAVASVDRYVDGTYTGGSHGLSRFDVTLLDATGAPTASAPRQIRVDAEWVVGPSEAEGARSRQAFRRSAWSTTIQPLGLQ